MAAQLNHFVTRCSQPYTKEGLPEGMSRGRLVLESLAD